MATKRKSKAKRKPAKAKAKRKVAKTKRKPAKRKPAKAKAKPKSARAAKPRAAKKPAAAPIVIAPSSGGSVAWTRATGEVGIRVRMYRVGFGDFFLLTFLAEAAEPIHVIVDCGVFKGTKQTGDIGTIESAVADMVQTTGGKVALIIMTHRHADHIAGFARCAATYKKLTVGAVWMSIWESQYSTTAVKFQAELTRTALALRSHFAALGATASAGENTAHQFMLNATGEDGGGPKGSNAVALNLLKQGFAGVTPEYYQAGDTAKLPSMLANAGVAAQILGPPPVADLDLMKLMDLKKGVGQYLTQDPTVQTKSGSPFGPNWEADLPTSYRPESFREWLPTRTSDKPVSTQDADAARSVMQTVLGQSQPGAALTAAKQLNSFLNNQSLVILFTFKGKKLLFVGDAQAGNWEHWLFETDTPDKAASGAIKTAAQQILTSIDFYKVGHHGSGNATPKPAVRAMGLGGKKFAAMCSTQADVYGTEDPEDETKGTEVPRVPLLTQLASESNFVRSDQIPVTSNDKVVVAAKVDGKLPESAAGTRFEQGAIWVDCFL
jgi:beta-lactamase superfamily II metal-dependent hydrolase